MANTYLYGAYGHIGETIAQSSTQAGTVPVHIGTAPINLVRGYKELNLVNKPVKIVNYVNAQKKMGLSSDWAKFTLCESMAAHFDNPLGNIGPAYLINVLDPDVHRKSAQTTKAVTFTNGRAEFITDTIILDTLAIEDKAEGVDFSIDYNYIKNSVILTSLDAASPLTGSVNVNFYEIDTTELDPATSDGSIIIGGTTASGACTGLAAIKFLYQEQNQVANLILAPGWSHIPAVYNALITAAQKINGHWDAFALGDIPLKAAGGEAVDTIEKANNWKKQHGYNNERTKVCWPMGLDNANRKFHLSTLAAVELMRADFSHNSVPMETCGNKQIPIIKQYFGEGSDNAGFDQQEANELTQNGICTCIYWAGNWTLWGDHTAAYSYGADVDPRAIFDVNMRMLMHITNSFQREWSPKIDKPMTLQLKERIINREQEKLDGYVSMGALIGEPTILFLESENSTTDLMNGDFRWDIAATPTPPLKSATVYVAYTDAGFTAYFKDEEAA